MLKEAPLQIPSEAINLNPSPSVPHFSAHPSYIKLSASIYSTSCALPSAVRPLVPRPLVGLPGAHNSILQPVGPSLGRSTDADGHFAGQRGEEGEGQTRLASLAWYTALTLGARRVLLEEGEEGRSSHAASRSARFYKPKSDSDLEFQRNTRAESWATLRGRLTQEK